LSQYFNRIWDLAVAIPFTAMKQESKAERLKSSSLALDHLRLLLNSVRTPFSATEGIEMARHRSATNGARLKTRGLGCVNMG